MLLVLDFGVQFWQVFQGYVQSWGKISCASLASFQGLSQVQPRSRIPNPNIEHANIFLLRLSACVVLRLENQGERLAPFLQFRLGLKQQWTVRSLQHARKISSTHQMTTKVLPCYSPHMALVTRSQNLHRAQGYSAPLGTSHLKQVRQSKHVAAGTRRKKCSLFDGSRMWPWASRRFPWDCPSPAHHFETMIKSDNLFRSLPSCSGASNSINTETRTSLLPKGSHKTITCGPLCTQLSTYHAARLAHRQNKAFCATGYQHYCSWCSTTD